LRDHTVLVARKPLDGEVRRALLISTCGIAGAHSTMVAMKLLPVGDR
jgi:hypothetical protein